MSARDLAGRAAQAIAAGVLAAMVIGGILQGDKPPPAWECKAAPDKVGCEQYRP